MSMERRVGNKIGGFFSEFWAFAAKGNAIQLAIGVVLGSSFGAIVNSLVNNIITPFISLLTGNVNFGALGYTIRSATTVNGTTTPALVIGYGALIQATINFLIVGLSIFLIFKLLQGVIKRFQHQEAQTPPSPPTSNEEKLLVEIRDILKSQSQQKTKNPGA
ncbi:MAG TPA: large conductance mechanosensitive channel protein MscL [Candidatus Paceibacterota bacterium]|nr:large conductance mechanosensitive channel protein MscL [Candidatus Paceibacterota bacterium]